MVVEIPKQPSLCQDQAGRHLLIQMPKHSNILSSRITFLSVRLRVQIGNDWQNFWQSQVDEITWYHLDNKDIHATSYNITLNQSYVQTYSGVTEPKRHCVEFVKFVRCYKCSLWFHSFRHWELPIFTSSFQGRKLSDSLKCVEIVVYMYEV